MNKHLFSICWLTIASFSPVTWADISFQEWKQKQQQHFSEFKDARDQAFMSYLEQQWQEFALFKGKTQDNHPKPAKAPAKKHSVFSTTLLDHTLGDNKKPVLEGPTLQLPEYIGFYGHHIPFTWVDMVTLSNLDHPDSDAIAAAWSTMGRSDYETSIESIKQIIQNYDMGDWATVEYINVLASAIYEQPNAQVLFSWFVLTKLGLDVRVAFTQSNLLLLMASTQNIYGKPFMEVQGRTYYMVGHSGSAGDQVFSYPQNKAYQNRSADLSFKRTVRVSQKIQMQSLQYVIDGKRLTAELSYDLGKTAFYANYPQIDLEHYFRTQPSDTLGDSLAKALMPELSNAANSREAANIILHFVQNAFVYQRDEDQFGEENYLLMDESFHYLQNDCEDRAVLTAWLMTSLLGLDVVGLDYPGHVALAVALPPQAGDWAARIHGKTYVMADPTYIGADIGMVMPEVEKKRPEIILR